MNRVFFWLMLLVIFSWKSVKKFPELICLSPLSQNSDHYANICPVMSSLCLVSLSRFLRRLVLHQTQVSCLFAGLFFWGSPTHSSVMFEKIRQHLTKKKPNNLFNPVNTMPIYSWQIQTFLGVGRKWLAASKMLELVWIWNPLGSEPPERKKVFCGQGS